MAMETRLILRGITRRCFTVVRVGASRPTHALHIYAETFPPLRKVHGRSRRRRAACFGLLVAHLRTNVSRGVQITRQRALLAGYLAGAGCR